MKQILTIFFLMSLTYSVFSTEQEADLLIIESDTIYLKTFPLETLKLTYSPFRHTRQTAYSTACWRGYRAIWKIIDNQLFLEKIVNCRTSPKKENEQQNIKDLFNENGIDFQEKNGMILADWINQDFYEMTFSVANFHKDKIFLYDGRKEEKNHMNENLRLKIVKGEIKLNRLKK